ncbi:MAG: carbamoyltransferase HypF [Nanoarchaeota archaeon]
MYKILIKGIVQGVGFRPFVYREAKKRKLKGEVKNTGSRVEIIVDKKEPIEEFLKNPPPLAKVESISIQKISKHEYDDFYISKSSGGKGEAHLPSDVFVCEKCLEEMNDKKNRRYKYYFITCTDCGPRFSIIEDVPYDRPNTSMDDFPMCEKCRKEYQDPLNRRYHAQTIACHECGPRLKLLEKQNEVACKTDYDVIEKTAELILKGEIVSIKGIGGFHLACKTDSYVVGKLRELLKRDDKPFAIMVKDIEMLKKIAKTTTLEKEIIQSPERSIVVVEKKEKEKFNAVSELDSIGVMLPYTALHYLLFEKINEPIVMTSANIPGEPVLTKEGISKYHLTNNRRIVNRCDDSVIRVIKNHPVFLRRSRGYAPMPLNLPLKCNNTVSLGAETNNTVCIGKGNKAFLSQHIGNCSKVKTYSFLKETVEKLIKLTNTKPKIITCDLHPGYQTTKYAQELAKKYNAKVIKVQHHKAHLAHTAAEHNLNEFAGVACDGLGFGEDDNLWGGEIFNVEKGNYKRIGHIEKNYMIGGDSATKNPKKMLFGILYKIISEEELVNFGLFEKKEANVLLKQLKENFNVFETTSTGRVLDAVSALLGFCEKNTYEGRPAMLLESNSTTPYDIEPVIEEKYGKKIVKTLPLIEYIVDNASKDKKRLAATAHVYIAKGLLKIAKETGKPVVFSGGVTYNRLITGYFLENGAYIPSKAPPGDGGISVGQCIIANIKH